MGTEAAVDWHLDTQSLRKRIDLAHETEWRHDVADHLDKIDKCLRDTRDLGLRHETELKTTASESDIKSLHGRIELLGERLDNLRKITWGVLVVFVMTILVNYLRTK
jgi:hypothetical protein